MGDYIDGRFEVTVTGIVTLASSDCICSAISWGLSTQCSPVENNSGCDVEHGFNFTISSDLIFLDDEKKSEGVIARIILDFVSRYDRAFCLSVT